MWQSASKSTPSARPPTPPNTHTPPRASAQRRLCSFLNPPSLPWCSDLRGVTSLRRLTSGGGASFHVCKAAVRGGVLSEALESEDPGREMLQCKHTAGQPYGGSSELAILQGYKVSGEELRKRPRQAAQSTRLFPYQERVLARVRLCATPGAVPPPGSSIPGTLQTRILQWVAMPSSTASSPPRNRTWVSCIAHGLFTTELLREPYGSTPPPKQKANLIYSVVNNILRSTLCQEILTLWASKAFLGQRVEWKVPHFKLGL